MAVKDKLTDLSIKAGLKAAAKAGKPKKLSDGARLYLLCHPNGAAQWRYRYFRPTGPENMLSLDEYPAVSLKEARKRRDEATEDLARGIDPAEKRKAEKAAVIARAEEERLAADGKPLPGTFEFVAREWWTDVHSRDVSADYAARTLVRFEQDAFPWVGRLPINEVTPPVLLGLLKKVAARGAVETAHRLKHSCAQVFRYGIAIGYCDRDNAADLKGALPATESRKHAAITDPEKFAGLLKDMARYRGQRLTRDALALSAYLMLRPGNVRSLEWKWVDLGEALLTIPSASMKGTKKAKASGVPFEVPLSRQAVAILAELQPLTGAGQYVFRGARDPKKCMSENTVNAALARLGYGTKDSPDDAAEGTTMNAHGFRASARTMAEKRLGIRANVLEEALAHGKQDAHGGAYDRTEWLDERVDAMQKWADYVDRLRDGSNVVPLKGAA